VFRAKKLGELAPRHEGALVTRQDDRLQNPEIFAAMTSQT
jgi:hypothetical protein